MACLENRVFDLCVVGAGLVGSAAARHASDAGHSVCLVGPSEPQETDEWTSREIFGSHYDEGRITRIWDSDPVLRVLNKESINRYEQLESQTNVKFHHPVGCLFFGQNGTSFIENLKTAIMDEQKDGRSILEDLTDRETFRERFPFLRCASNESAFLDTGGAGHISPRAMVKAQQVAALQRGCIIHREVIEQVSPEEHEGQTLMKLVTSSGQSITSRRVLLCTNAFTLLKPGLLAHSGRLQRPDLHLVKITAALLKVSEEESKRLRSMPSLVYRRLAQEGQHASSYALPPIKYPDGLWYMKIGVFSEDEQEKNSPNEPNIVEVKNWFLSKGSKSRTKEGADLLKDLVPDLQVDCVNSVSCVACHTPTGLPYIDIINPNLGVAVGGNGVAAKCSDELGRIAAYLIAENKWTSEIPKERFTIRWRD